MRYISSIFASLSQTVPTAMHAEDIKMEYFALQKDELTHYSAATQQPWAIK